MRGCFWSSHLQVGYFYRMEKLHLAVIGGGAAGFFCAINAARLQPQLKVTIVEKTSKLLSKVRVSGGGRCNVTHACFDLAPLVKNYPRGTHFLKKTFRHFDTKACVQWFEERGVKLKIEADGRMFSVTDRSQTIIDCLIKEANQYGVDILMNRDVKSIERQKDRWVLNTADTPPLMADFICVACGGFPKAAMFGWLQQTGHSIEAPVPSLFTFNIPGPLSQLMGISVEKAMIKVAGSKLSSAGPILITHWGLSGPAVLKLSAWGAREFAQANYNFNIIVNWIPDYNEQLLRDSWIQVRTTHSAQKMVNRNPFGLPARLWSSLLQYSDITEDMRWADLPAKAQNKLIKNLVAMELEVKGKTTFKEEFVTCGGIQLSEVEPQTMESRLVPNLYFAGEILDVDGVTGGFNFQHAWTSGYIAATAIVNKIQDAIGK